MHPLKGNCLTCRRPWKDIIAEQHEYEYGVFESRGIKYTCHKVGSGISERLCSGYKTEADRVADSLKAKHFPGERKLGELFPGPAAYLWHGSFNKFVAGEEADDLGTLQRAKLLTDTAKEYTLPGKQDTWRCVLHTLEKNGFRQYVEKEWYAAKILTEISSFRDNLCGERDSKIGDLEGIVVQAMTLGGLIREARIRFGPISNISRKGGKTRGKQQTKDRKEEWAKWQVEADKIWKEHPGWEIERVAKKVQKKFPNETVRTIRFRIKKPAP